MLIHVPPPILHYSKHKHNSTYLRMNYDFFIIYYYDTSLIKFVSMTI